MDPSATVEVASLCLLGGIITFLSAAALRIWNKRPARLLCWIGTACIVMWFLLLLTLDVAWPFVIGIGVVIGGALYAWRHT